MHAEGGSLRRAKRRFQPLATRFTIFTAALVVWMTAVECWADYALGRPRPLDSLIVSGGVLIVAVLMVRTTSRIFVRPLIMLESAMGQVKDGNLECIQVSASSDEVERLGHRFNEMIQALGASRKQVREYQEHLEQKIRERTEDLLTLMRRAEEAARSKSEFLSNMSHELRTPLNGILGMIDIVLDSPLTARQREDLETARHCASSLLALLNNILDLSSFEAGKMTFDNVAFDPRELFRSCLGLLAPRAVHKGLKLECEIADDVPPCLNGDPARVRQLVFHLLQNAVEYTDQGSVTLKIGLVPPAKTANVRLRLDVIDTGIGIPAGMINDIFQMFTQADGGTTRKHSGGGVGLALAKRIAQNYEGRIWVESETGRGSAFHAEVELCAANPESVEWATHGAPTPATYLTSVDSAAVRSGQILVVEDNLVNQQVVAGLLAKRGYRATVANHGGEALEALEAASFDLILMDVQMPVLDGLEATRRIRADRRWRDLPIVGLTAHAMAGDRERCIQAGMNDYLPKPVRPPALIETVRRYIPAPATG
jgi:signal transduction histidine kinase